MSKRKPVLPAIRDMQRQVDLTFSGIVNREAVENELRAAEAVIRAAGRISVDGEDNVSYARYAAMKRAITRLDRLTKGTP